MVSEVLQQWRVSAEKAVTGEFYVCFESVNGEMEDGASMRVAQPPQLAANSANAFTILPPEPFDFPEPQDWKRWKV